MRINDGQWHHLVAVRDGAKASLYVDGKLAASRNDIQGAVEPDTALIGGRLFGEKASFKGLIDDLRLYTRMLSEAEIKTLYEEGNAN